MSNLHIRHTLVAMFTTGVAFSVRYSLGQNNSRALPWSQPNGSTSVDEIDAWFALRINNRPWSNAWILWRTVIWAATVCVICEVSALINQNKAKRNYKSSRGLTREYCVSRSHSSHAEGNTRGKTSSSVSFPVPHPATLAWADMAAQSARTARTFPGCTRTNQPLLTLVIVMLLPSGLCSEPHDLPSSLGLNSALRSCTASVTSPLFMICRVLWPRYTAWIFVAAFSVCGSSRLMSGTKWRDTFTSQNVLCDVVGRNVDI